MLPLHALLSGRGHASPFHVGDGLRIGDEGMAAGDVVWTEVRVPLLHDAIADVRETAFQGRVKLDAVELQVAPSLLHALALGATEVIRLFP